MRYDIAQLIVWVVEHCPQYVPNSRVARMAGAIKSRQRKLVEASMILVKHNGL
jgi:hypothetical protein